MFSLRRQWHRARFAYDLLLEYEREERDQLSLPEALRRLEGVGEWRCELKSAGYGRWRAAARDSKISA